MANIRRNRGYSYEHTLVQRLNNGEWNARRLGGSSTGLPDIIAVNNSAAILLSIEAKSGTGDNLYVPADQIERCFSIRDMFRFYKIRHVILAFKFMRKKRYTRKGSIVYERRKLIEYYKNADRLEEEINDKTSFPIIRCRYDGKLFAIRARECVMLDNRYLEEYKMPFRSTKLLS